MSDLICVGTLGGSFGVRGEVRLKSYCAEPGTIEDYSPLTDETGSRNFHLRLTRQIKNGFAGRIDGVDDKDAADALRGVGLFARRDQLPALPDDEFYHADLIGLPVHDSGGALLGHVRAVHDHGAGDLLEIAGPGLKDSVLLPFTTQNVPTVDLGAGRIVADPPDGLF